MTLGISLDQRATPDQKQALETILSGEVGGFFAALGTLVENTLPKKQVPIQYETVDGNARIVVDGLLEHATESLRHPMMDQPLDITINNSATGLYDGPWTPCRTIGVKLMDPELSFEYSGSHACTGKFDYNGP